MLGKITDKTKDADYLILDQLIPSNHYLRSINKHIDFSFINTITESCYCPNNGRPSIAPELYFRMMLIGYIFSIKSTRQLVQDIRFNLSYRWFCGLTLNDSIPHHASLSRIKKRYTVAVFEHFFESIITQCKKAGLLKSQSVMTDSTLIQANASLNSMKPINKEVPKNIKPSKDGISENKWQISNLTHRSISDPDSSLAFKSGTARSLKYKAHVCCDSESRVITTIKLIGIMFIHFLVNRMSSFAIIANLIEIFWNYRPPISLRMLLRKSRLLALLQILIGRVGGMRVVN